MNTNPRYQKNRPFLCIDVIGRPADGVRTERRGWGNEARNWNSGEQSYVVDRINDKTMARATVIIDLVEDRLVKSRYNADEAEGVIKHYRNKYAEKIEEGMRLWLARKLIAGAAA